MNKQTANGLFSLHCLFCLHFFAILSDHIMLLGCELLTLVRLTNWPAGNLPKQSSNSPKTTPYYDFADPSWSSGKDSLFLWRDVLIRLQYEPLQRGSSSSQICDLPIYIARSRWNLNIGSWVGMSVVYNLFDICTGSPYSLTAGYLLKEMAEQTSNRHLFRCLALLAWT